jgi:hypothetical protein
MDKRGTVIRYNTITENFVLLNKYVNDQYIVGQLNRSVNIIPNDYQYQMIRFSEKYLPSDLVPYGLGNKDLSASDFLIDNFLPSEYVYINSNSEDVYSIVKNKGSIYGFNGYDAKNFYRDTALYVRNKNELIQESYDRSSKITNLYSSSEIRDFIINDEMDYYVIHNTTKVSVFTKDRIFKYSINGNTSLFNKAFSAYALNTTNGIELLKIDIVREYTDLGLETYPIILGKINTGTTTLSSNQLFLCKLDEINKDITNVTFLPLTGNYYSYGDLNRVNYNLTNYEYLKNRYKQKNELIFKLTLKNVYNNRDIINVEIPIDINSFKNEYHHFAFRVNGIDGKVSVMCDGREVQTVNIQPGQYIFQEVFSESINIGNTYFYNDQSLSDYIGQKNYYYVKDYKLKQFKLYKKALSDSEVMFHVYNGVDMKDMVASLPSDQRNELDGIERQFKLDTNGNKSNSINIIVKNSKITNSLLKEKMKEVISEKLKKILPITTTINNIEFR